MRVNKNVKLDIGYIVRERISCPKEEDYLRDFLKTKYPFLYNEKSDLKHYTGLHSKIREDLSNGKLTEGFLRTLLYERKLDGQKNQTSSWQNFDYIDELYQLDGHVNRLDFFQKNPKKFVEWYPDALIDAIKNRLGNSGKVPVEASFYETAAANAEIKGPNRKYGWIGLLILIGICVAAFWAYRTREIPSGIPSEPSFVYEVYFRGIHDKQEETGKRIATVWQRGKIYFWEQNDSTYKVRADSMFSGEYINISMNGSAKIVDSKFIEIDLRQSLLSHSIITHHCSGILPSKMKTKNPDWGIFEMHYLAYSSVGDMITSRPAFFIPQRLVTAKRSACFRDYILSLRPDTLSPLLYLNNDLKDKCICVND